ncbi:uncharacterized protein LOC111909893 isoform X2 [Lactuca sativa]|uniref:uncharacterized protein LOC111909893 isoform X2 n=1 Tax=Lactuca sativa TaxID=4236 RepID=UPI001C694207|nr:uncharacterized protein LOC111909893 isoform X2 [Lactuca sativa]
MRDWTLSTNEIPSLLSLSLPVPAISPNCTLYILQFLSTTTTQSVQLLRHMSSSQVGKQRISMMNSQVSFDLDRRCLMKCLHESKYKKVIHFILDGYRVYNLAYGEGYRCESCICGNRYTFLMAQMRHLTGFLQTTHQLLTFIDDHWMNWIGFVVSHHLNSHYECVCKNEELSCILPDTYL